jgi:hypothetical protein
MITLWAESSKDTKCLNLFFSQRWNLTWFTISPKDPDAIKQTEDLIEKLDAARAFAVNYLYNLNNPNVEGANASKPNN